MLDAIRQYLLSKPGAGVDYPFGADIEVYKVAGKMFATLAFGNDKQHYWMNLKCDPDEASALRDIFDAVIPGYHMNKHHWNTVILDGSLPNTEVERMIDNSFSLVIKGLPKKQQIQYLTDEPG